MLRASIPAVLLIGLAGVLGGCGMQRRSVPPSSGDSESGAGPVELTDENFAREVLEHNQPVLVDFWAKWCPQCIDMKPTIQRLDRELAGKVKIGELDVERNAFVAEKYQVRRYPTLILFINGEEVRRLEGMQSEEELSELLHSIADRT